MQISAAQSEDIESAAACMAAAFSVDPILGAFFSGSPLGRDKATACFFHFLLEARIALGMPALVAREGTRVVGLVMGDDTLNPAWPPEIMARWTDFESLHPDLGGQFATYDAIVASCGVDQPHYHLGALGVDPGHRGTGLGKALVHAFLDLSDRDPNSCGTMLETGTPSNLGLYRHLGFEVKASGPLADALLWCMYRPKPD